MSRRLLLALLPLFVLGCWPVPSVPPPLPEMPPPYPDTAALRPAIAFDGEHLYCGTGFVVADTAGKKYLITAESILGDKYEWPSARSIILDHMNSADGAAIATCAARPLYIGRSYLHGDCTADMVIWPLDDGEKVQPLKLAATDPKPNEVVWGVGEATPASGPKAYRFRVRDQIDGGLALAAVDSPLMSRFEGAPLLNANGEVVGIVLGERNWPASVAGTVSGIRRRLSEAGVSVP